MPIDPEFDHPPGAALARILVEELGTSGWSTGEIENWRDCGWSLECRRARAELQVTLSLIQDSQWMLQISPMRRPGLLGSFLGRVASASNNDVYDLSVAVHAALGRLHYLGSPMWR